MRVAFDRFNTLEPPQLILCNPHCRCTADDILTAPIGVLPNVSDLEIVDNFNELSELSFTITSCDMVPSSIYAAITNRRTVFVEGMGFFLINSVEEHESEDGVYKSVNCVSCEAELENRLMPYIGDGEYTLEDITTMISESVINWQFMSYTDTAPIAITKTRVFEDVNSEGDILSYLIDELQDNFHVLFIFDTVYRKISVYDQDGYTQSSAVQLSIHDVLESVEVKENSEDIYTCLNVVGGNDLNILPVNPLGTNRIYNFAHYKSWMSSGLRDAVESWESSLAGQHIQPTDNMQLDTPATVIYDESAGGYRVLWQNNGHEVRTPLSMVKYPKLAQLYYQLSDDISTAKWNLENAKTLYELYSKCSQNVAAEAVRADEDAGYMVSTYNEAIGNPSQIQMNAVAGEKNRILAQLGDDSSGLIGEQKAIMDTYAETAPEYIAAKVLYDAYGACKENITNMLDSDGANIQAEINSCNNIVAPRDGTRVSNIHIQIDSLQKKLLELISEQEQLITAYSAEISGAHALSDKRKAVDTQMQTINQSLAFSNTTMFSGPQQQELSSYIFQATYTNENLIITDSMDNSDMFKQSLELYNDAVDELSVLCHPSEEFSVDAKFFIGWADHQSITSKIEVGRRLVSIELYDGDVADLFLTSITANYSDYSLTLTFGRRYNKYDNRTLYGDLFSNIQKTAADIRSLQVATYPVTHGELTALTTSIRNAREVTKLSAITADNQEVSIDDTGLTAKRSIGGGEFSPEQLKIVNNAIVFTKDNWGSAVAAIGKMVIDDVVTYGVNGQAIVGELIVGDRLALNVNEKDIGAWLRELEAGVVRASQYQQYMSFDPSTGLMIAELPVDSSTSETPIFYTVQRGDGYYFYRSSNKETPFMSITSIDGKMHLNIMEVTDRMSIGSDEYGGYFDFITTDAGLAIKWRNTQNASV